MDQIPIYIISLKRTPERRLCIQRQLDSFGLDYQWIDAVDAYDFSAAKRRRMKSPKYEQAAMACLLSHIKFYDLVIQNKHPMACVLEDDAQLLPTFPDILNYEKLSKKNWGILLLSHHSLIARNLIQLYCKSFISHSKQKIKLDDLLYWECLMGAITKNSYTKYIKDHYIAKPLLPTDETAAKSTMAYLIRLSAAEKIRKIAFANRKSIYSDDVTGYAYHFGVPLRLITPPCAMPNITYLNFSTIAPINENRTSSMIDLPHLTLLQLYARNKWMTLASLAFSRKLRIRLKIRLITLFLINIKDIAFLKIRDYLHPHKRFDARIRKIKV